MGQGVVGDWVGCE